MLQENSDQRAGIDELDVAAVWPDTSSLSLDPGVAQERLSAPSTQRDRPGTRR